MFDNYSKMKRKGITPIIAIVLLLMMTVAAFGLTFVWVQETQSEIQESISQDITDITDKNSATFNIESIYNTTAGKIEIILRNTGRYTFKDLGAFSIYVDGQFKTTYTNDITEFEPQSIGTLTSTDNWSDFDDSKTHSIKIVSPMSTETAYTCVPSKTEDGYC